MNFYVNNYIDVNFMKEEPLRIGNGQVLYRNGKH